MFDVDEFIASCVACLDDSDPRRAARDLLERALSAPDAIADAMKPDEGGIALLYNTPEMTVINVVWTPGLRLYPHNHEMWAIIGVYAGREDNEFFRRDAEAGGLVPSNGKSLDAGEVVSLGDDVIHAVSNPLTKPTGGIHIYGGDFIKNPRSMWPPPDGEEKPYDPAVVNRLFAEADAAWRASTNN